MLGHSDVKHCCGKEQPCVGNARQCDDMHGNAEAKLRRALHRKGKAEKCTPMVPHCYGSGYVPRRPAGAEQRVAGHSGGDAARSNAQAQYSNA